MSTTLGAYLRQSTLDAHRNLDRHRVLRPLLKPGLRQEEYTGALLALYPAQCQLEEAIHRGLHRLQLDYPLLSRVSALAGDLTTLAQRLPVHDGTACLDVGRPGQLIGLLYVLEGAKLGSRVIAHNIHRTLGTQVPSRYFSVAQEEDNWRDFWRFAECHCTEEEWLSAASAANSAFRLFLSCLDAYQAADTVMGTRC
ncbi:biliverdin-producing heme oxygenase [Oceanisphaera psychrotolerans]|uniref:Heme oxygenase n=1 Tax=Oceanisphaera psychrotolerans TaxID=1414654 RepID=A0A1J4Q9A9_9GAMM|nr:biliverdin-producing heme oxygenase [Oceanisphaera psychrotolerans]OIN04330.1 hypothetical protein BFR47_06945 [Oceanisphaera psychrotolerans]